MNTSTHSDIHSPQTFRMPAAAQTSDLWKRFETACLELTPAKPVDQNVVANKLKASQSTVSNWKRGEKTPPIKRGIALAKYAGLCTEYLYTGQGPRRPWGDMSRPLATLVDVWEELDPADRDKVLEYARLLRMQKNQPLPAGVHNISPIRKSLPKTPP